MFTTFEEVDAHQENTNATAATQPGGQLHFTTSDVATDPAGVLSKICGVYHLVRPIIVLIVSIKLFPKKWRDNLAAHNSTMDKLCP